MIYRTYYLSPLGRILLAADDIGLIGVWFEGQKYFGEFPGHMNYVFEEKENHILKDALRWLDIYFSGQKPDFLPKLHLIFREKCGIFYWRFLMVRQLLTAKLPAK